MIYFIIVVLIAFFDQITKILITKNLPFGTSKVVVKNIVYFTHVKNTGGAFSIFQGKQLIFICISIVIIAFLIWAIFLTKTKNHKKIILTLILGGALGNLIDRLFRGYVIDFIDFRFWPVFNVADSFITIGIVLFIVVFILEGRDVSSWSKDS